MPNIYPNSSWRYAFKRGMVGWDVAALQLQFPWLTFDGDFGEETEVAVMQFQREVGLNADGVAGPETQRHLIRMAAGPVQKNYSLPGGSLLSISTNESGLYIAAYAPHASDAGYDLGAFQRNIPFNAEQATIRAALRLPQIAEWTGSNLRRLHDKFVDPVPAKGWYLDNVANGLYGRLAWQLAFLNHNWPAAAESIWKRGYIGQGDYDTSYQPWVYAASGGRLTTPREWAVSYIERATVFVRW